MEELKPCPVCGNNDIDGWTYGEGSVPFIPENVKDLTWVCEDDTCPYSLDKPIIVEVWNKRITDQLMEENVELRETLRLLVSKGIEINNIDEIEDEEDAFTVQCNFNDALIKANQLLNK